MSREAFGDPPEQQDVPECCPNCGSDFYMPGCTHCDEVKQRCAAESEALALRGQLGAASGWIVKALKVLDTVDPDDTDEAERLAALSRPAKCWPWRPWPAARRPTWSSAAVLGPLERRVRPADLEKQNGRTRRQGARP